MTKATARSVLAQIGVVPIGLRREEAAAYINVSARKFDAMVDDGRMPKPKMVDGIKVWSRLSLDRAFAALPDERGESDVDDIWSRTQV